MAELLVRAVNNTSGHTLAWQRGMIVEIQADGYLWPPRIALPPAQGGKHVVIKITDVTVVQVKNFILNRWGIDPCDEEVGMPEFPDLRTRRRVIQILVDNLPNNVRNQLRTTGVFSTTWPQIRSFVQNIRTGETA